MVSYNFSCHANPSSFILVSGLIVWRFSWVFFKGKLVSLHDKSSHYCHTSTHSCVTVHQHRAALSTGLAQEGHALVQVAQQVGLGLVQHGHEEPLQALDLEVGLLRIHQEHGRDAHPLQVARFQDDRDSARVQHLWRRARRSQPPASNRAAPSGRRPRPCFIVDPAFICSDLPQQ